MKILHTSDWHLGHMLYNESQEEAQQDMLRQIAEKVAEEQPDLLIIAGDVYDTTQPSAAVQLMFADAIVGFHRACPNMKVVCIAGNHDSGSKHMVYHTPWRELGVHMLGAITKESRLEDYIVEVPGTCFVAAVPFVADRYMPDDVFRKLSDMIEQRNTDRLPVVLTAHLAFEKADRRGHEDSSDTNIGGLDCKQLEVLGKGYDYVALGHIHRQQALDEEKRIWYSGTPIAVSFDESYAGNAHGVLLVELGKHGDKADVTPFELNNLHPLVNLPYEGYGQWDDVKDLFRSYDKDIASFVRLNVEVEGYLPAGANDEAHAIAADKKCTLCVVNSRRKQSETQSQARKVLTTTELKDTDIIEIAEMYLVDKGEALDDDLRAMLKEIKDLIKTDNH